MSRDDSLASGVQPRQLLTREAALDFCLGLRRVDLKLTDEQIRASETYARTHADRFALVMNRLAPLLPESPTIFSVGSMPNQIELLFARVLGAKVIGSTFSPLDKRDKFTAVYEHRDGWRYEMEVYLRDFTRDPLPVESQSCDAVLCFEVVEHFLNSPVAIFQECNRVLKPAGHLLLSTPNMQHWHRLLYLLNGMTYPDLDFHEPVESRHTHIFSLRELQQMLGTAGFEVVAHFFDDPWGNAGKKAQFDMEEPLNKAVVELLSGKEEFQHECVFLAARASGNALSLAGGWHEVERDGSGWWSWSSGRGVVRAVAKKDTNAVLTGELYSIQSPNEVDVLINGKRHTLIQITWDLFHSFPPLQVPLRQGENLIEFVSRNPAIQLPTDQRPLAIAVKNLKLK